MTANTYTLRYESSGSEEAVISPDETEVQVTNASGKYLMVQNNNGLYVMMIDANSKTVNASDIVMGSRLKNFNNCKVWIESTNDRITTAKMAIQPTLTTINSVAVTDIEFTQVLQAYGSNFNSIQKYAKKQRKRKCQNRQEAWKPEIDMDQQRKKGNK